MAKQSFYLKRGNLNYKERKLIADIQEALDRNPALKKQLTQATNFKELEDLKIKMVSEDASIVENVTEPSESKETIEPEVKSNQQDNMSANDQKPPQQFDPFNRQEPIVRDYVLDDQFDSENTTKKNNTTNFHEPQNYAEAFDIPQAEDDDADSQPSTSSSGSGRSGGSGSSGSSSGGGFTRSDDYSSGSDSGDPAKAKRRSKRFAKSVVNMVCTLAELGFIWWTSKEINENKLAEYELSGEFDLSQILEMEDGQQVTVKQFFLNQLGTIQQASKISDDDRAELTDALAEVFIEENIQPSPKWDLAFSALTVFGKQGMIAFSIQQQQKAVLEQLRIKKETGYAPTPPPQPTYTPPPPPPPMPQRPSTPSTSTPIHNALDQELSYDLSLIDSLTNPIETKE
jgi:hypothetical protein